MIHQSNIESFFCSGGIAPYGGGGARTMITTGASHPAFHACSLYLTTALYVWPMQESPMRRFARWLVAARPFLLLNLPA